MGLYTQFFTIAVAAVMRFSACFGADDDQARKLMASGDYKAAIAEYQALVKKAAPDAKGEWERLLALAYLKDQDQEMAFKVFLESLDDTKGAPSPSLPVDETAYKKALAIYQEHGAASAGETSRKILLEFEPILKANPQDHKLGFIVAAAYANQGRFDDFFDLFYRSYQAYPQHWLVYKTKAVLHIKLFERARTAEEREAQRRKILESVGKGLEINPTDTSLYKLVIAYSPDKDKADSVKTYLNKIINNNIVIPRTELPFYVQQAVATKQHDLAERFIAKAHEWYQYSRAVNALQRYLEEHKN